MSRDAGATLRCLTVCVLLVAAVATAHAAAEPVGEVVALDGTGDIQRGSAQVVLTLGAKIELADRVRTHTPGRARLLFADGSTLVLGDGSDLLIDDHVFDPSGGKTRTLLRVFQGKVRALVSEYYGDADASYEIQTPGAVAGVRGTEFIVGYDSASGSTEIAAFSGRVAVRAAADHATAAVMVAADQITSVKNGRAPEKPRALSAADKARYLEVLQLSGLGEIDATLEQDPVLGGEEVPRSENPASGGTDGGTPEGIGEDPGGRPTTPSDPVGQPIPALEGPGQVGVPF